MERVRDAFRRQAVACRTLGSPFTALVCDLLAERLDEGSAFGRRILAWPGDPVADALALRAAGTLHALARSGRDPALARAYPPDAGSADVLWEAIHGAVAAHDEALAAGLDSPPQTNEVKRCAALLGGCLVVAARTGRPLDLLEIGSSAGLNLALDRYRYDLGSSAWGHSASPVLIRSDWRGDTPPLDAPLTIASRWGCDIRPLDPASPTDRERLLSYIWPDQADRLATTAAALGHAAGAGWRVDRADAADWIEARLAEEPVPGRARVIMHSIVWQYLPEAVQSRISASIEAAAARATPDAPLAWLRMEADGAGEGAGLRLTLWPDSRDEPLGRADFHGRWVAWAVGRS
ncbi:DUF2332 domain-containing protein [Salinarimonas soli]|uniref:DUF2332 family protein n=1 Tax=Salinarimonas soli TaxID=1638099 RepID=A0A5B2VCP8_9HYPH|nr:DUF2332 family protein [Salinarimonas soli]KAA2236831.1 DUF2332 family protein [Salinarimonas soli]